MVQQITMLPSPSIPSGHLLIRTVSSLVSAGTERMLVEFGKASLLTRLDVIQIKSRKFLKRYVPMVFLLPSTLLQPRLDQPFSWLLQCWSCHWSRQVTGYQVGDRVISTALR